MARCFLVTILALAAAAGALGCEGPNPEYTGRLRLDGSELGDAAGPDVKDVPGGDPVPGGDAAADGGGTPDQPALDGGPEPDAGLPPADASAVDLASGLVGHWRFDEGVGTVARNDRAPAANMGTLENGAAWLMPGFAAQFSNPSCLVVDGVDDAVTIPAGGMPALGSPLTFSAWIWLPGNALSGRRTVLTYRGAATSTGFQLGVVNRAAAIWLYGTPAGTNLIVAPATLTLETWHHLAFTFDGTTHRLFADGLAAGTSTMASPSTAASGLRVASYGGAYELFGGRIDDLRVYARALSAPEIAALAQGR